MLFRSRFYPKPRTLLEKIVDQSDRDGASADLVEKLASPSEKLLLMQWKKIRAYGGVQARMPFEFTLH